jgi:hypothetical protein
MFGCRKPTKLREREMSILFKLTIVGKNREGEDDEKEYLGFTADRMAGFGDDYCA